MFIDSTDYISLIKFFCKSLQDTYFIRLLSILLTILVNNCYNNNNKNQKEEYVWDLAEVEELECYILKLSVKVRKINLELG